MENLAMCIDISYRGCTIKAEAPRGRRKRVSTGNAISTLRKVRNNRIHCAAVVFPLTSGARYRIPTRRDSWASSTLLCHWKLGENRHEAEARESNGRKKFQILLPGHPLLFALVCTPLCSGMDIWTTERVNRFMARDAWKQISLELFAFPCRRPDAIKA